MPALTPEQQAMSDALSGVYQGVSISQDAVRMLVQAGYSSAQGIAVYTTFAPDPPGVMAAGSFDAYGGLHNFEKIKVGDYIRSGKTPPDADKTCKEQLADTQNALKNAQADVATWQRRAYAYGYVDGGPEAPETPSGGEVPIDPGMGPGGVK